MTVPKDYVANQLEVNNRHLNGEVEVSYEEAIRHVKSLSAWIKQSGLPAESFLDAGCRTGYAMDALGTEFPAARVVGCDIVPDFVRVAELRGEAVEADLHALPFDNEEFDWTFCVTAIEHCYDAARAASELFRVSRVGCFVVTDLEDEARFEQNTSHYTHHNDPAEWVDVFRQPGWWLMSLNVPRYSRVDMLWVQQPLVAAYKKDEDTWR